MTFHATASLPHLQINMPVESAMSKPWKLSELSCALTMNKACGIVRMPGNILTYKQMLLRGTGCRAHEEYLLLEMLFNFSPLSLNVRRGGWKHGDNAFIFHLHSLACSINTRGRESNQ